MRVRNEREFRQNQRQIQRLWAKIADPAQSHNGATLAAFDRRVAADRKWLGVGQ